MWDITAPSSMQMRVSGKTLRTTLTLTSTKFSSLFNLAVLVLDTYINVMQVDTTCHGGKPASDQISESI